MNFIRAAFKHAPLDGPLTLEAEFYFAPPASASKKRRAAMLDGSESCLNPKDVDNMLKFVMDASNGILWHDDKQVVRLSGFKAYGERDRTVLRVGVAKFVPFTLGIGAGEEVIINQLVAGFVEEGLDAPYDKLVEDRAAFARAAEIKRRIQEDTEEDYAAF